MQCLPSRRPSVPVGTTLTTRTVDARRDGATNIVRVRLANQERVGSRHIARRRRNHWAWKVHHGCVRQLMITSCRKMKEFPCHYNRFCARTEFIGVTLIGVTFAILVMVSFLILSFLDSILALSFWWYVNHRCKRLVCAVPNTHSPIHRTVYRNIAGGYSEKAHTYHFAVVICVVDGDWQLVRAYLGACNSCYKLNNSATHRNVNKTCSYDRLNNSATHRNINKACRF